LFTDQKQLTAHTNMLNTKPFTRRIILLGVVPILVTTLLLLLGFAATQHHQRKTIETAITKILINSLTTPALDYDKNPTSLKFAATALLYIDPITHIAIIDKDKSMIENFGLPLNPTLLQLDHTNNTALRHEQTTFISVPLGNGAEQGWLLAGVRNNAFLISQYRGYFLILFVAACALVTTVYFASRLYNHITVPLKNILAELKQAITSESPGGTISLQKSHIYNDFIEILNQILLTQNSFREEMQAHVDQSTKELRETLETVEIQNIELDIARKNAVQASRAKSEFLANTSHELRTPLNGIIGFATLLLKTSLSNQQKDYLTTIEKSAQGLLTVINDLLDFSKIETGQLTLEYKPVFIRELIEEACTMYAPQAHEKNIRLLSMINHNVPRNLLGDPQRLKQVLSNLISNAIKFSPRGNIIIRANALSEVDGQLEIKFTVSDNGIGLSEEQQESLFSTLTKIDGSDSRMSSGTGLGLAIAKGLADRMKGQIGVDSTLNAGSTFWFTVRLGIDRQRPAQSPLVNSLYGLRGLVFDTNAVSRMEITHLLAGWGVNVVEESIFTNLNNPSQFIQSTQIDFAIMDVCHEENNFDKDKILKCVEKITSEFQIPTILLAPPSVQRLLQEHIVGFTNALLPRPILYLQLHQTVCNLLDIALPNPTLSENTSVVNNPPSAISSIRVLVVDDNPANRKLVCEFLKSIGTSVHVAEDGYQAANIVTNESFDLILMDVQMPGMDGLDTTRLIRSTEKGRRTPIVALTAHAVNERKTQLLLAGMDDFLSKPVSEDDLERIIDRWVTARKKAEDNESIPSNATPVETPTGTAPWTQSEDLFSWTESMSLAKHKADLAADMLTMLLVSLDDTERSIQHHLAACEYDQLLEIVHKFYGGCCYCGVPALRSASKRLEEIIPNHSEEEINLFANALIAEIQRLRIWSEEHDIPSLFADIDD
jgi:two-component system, NarL family, sensor histidine kinase BarA